MNDRGYTDEIETGSTDWLPVAQAAWHRATRDRDAAQRGGEAVLLIDGQSVAAAPVRRSEGHPWPVRGDHQDSPRDVALAILMLARMAGVPPQDLAEEMTRLGLPTTRSRLKSISTTEIGRRSAVSESELIVMCHAAAALLKQSAITTQK